MSVRNTFPQQRPTLNLDFANSKTLDPRITFTRTSTATYVDEDGLIKSVDADVARFDHDPVTGECLGLLIEEQRSNLTKNSGTLFDYSNTRVSNNTISTGGPFGTGYHEKTITDANTSNYNFNFGNQISITAGQTITFSIFLRNVDITNNQFYLRFWTGTGRAWTTTRQVRYNLTNLTTSVSSGTIVNSSIQPFPDDWYRLSMTATADQDGFAAESFLTSNNSVGEKYQLMGAQVEVGAFPTSYIPTSGSTATRNPDTVSITGTNFTKWSSDLEGTLGVTVIPTYETSSLTGTKTVIRFKGSGGGGDNIRYIRQNNNNVFDAASQTAYPSGPSNYSGAGDAILNEDNTIFIGYSESNDVFKLIKDGNSLVTKTGLASIESFALDLEGGRHLFKKIIFYPYLLSDSQLQTLTK